MSKKPKVTVALTSYNHAKFIRESIESILDQTFTDFEFYIIDDCSTDDSWDIINEYKDPRIIAIRNKENKNAGIQKDLFQKFKGEYFAIAHCDDKWSHVKLEKQVEYLDGHPEIAACFTGVHLFDQDGYEFNNLNHPYYDVFKIDNLSRKKRLKLLIEQGNHLCHPSCLIRSDVQLELQLFSYGLGSMPDYYRWLKLLISGYDIYVFPEMLTFMRIHLNGKNVSGMNDANIKRIQNDLFLLTSIFNNISSEDLEYLVEGKLQNSFSEIEKRFLLGNYLFSTIHYPFKLKGLQLIYDTLQDENSRQEILHKFAFSTNQMIEMTGKEDIFSVVDENSYLNMSVYYNADSEFSVCHTVSKKVFIAMDYFSVDFDLSNFRFTQLRFDPDEGIFRKFWDMHFYVDGKETVFKPIGNYEERDGKLEFYTTDPIFISVELDSGPHQIKISGHTTVLPNSDVEKIISKKANWIPPMGRKKALKFALTGKK